MASGSAVEGASAKLSSTPGFSGVRRSGSGKHTLRSPSTAKSLASLDPRLLGSGAASPRSSTTSNSNSSAKGQEQQQLGDSLANVEQLAVMRGLWRATQADLEAANAKAAAVREQSARVWSDLMELQVKER